MSSDPTMPAGQDAGQTIQTPKSPTWLPRLPYVIYKCVVKQNFEPLDDWFWVEAAGLKKGYELFLLILIIAGLVVYREWPKNQTAAQTPTLIIVTNTVAATSWHLKIKAIQYVPTTAIQ